jgi:two-component system, LuxR family, sensor kinase FixL
MTVAWPMVTAACLTLALINLRIAMGDVRRAPYVFFFISALAVAVVSVMELELLRADSLDGCNGLLRWSSLPLGIMVAAMTGFVWSFFGTGRAWLALAGVGLNELGQTMNLVSRVPVLRHAVAIRQVETFGGVRFTVPTIESGPWEMVAVASVILIIAFVIDASISLWRRGGRKRALIVGGSIVVFFFLARGQATLVEHGIVQTPYLMSFEFLAVLIAMGHELSAEVFSAAKLGRDLRESEARFRLVVESAPNAMIMVNSEGKIALINAQAEIVFCYPRTELIGQSIEVLIPGRFHHHHPDLRQGYLAHPTSRAMGAGRELFGRRRDGSEVPVEIGLNPIQTQEGAFVLASVIDITERKAAEHQAERHRNELAHLSRVSILGELAGALAHELNQPLTAMLNNSQAGLRFLRQELPDMAEITDLLNDIADDAKRAGGVIHGMRAMFKKDAQHETEAVCVNDAVNQGLSLLHAEIVTRKAAVVLHLGEGLPAVRAGRVEVQQVLINLIINGLDAMKTTGTPPGPMNISTACSDGHVIISVRDAGPGIPLEIMERLFEPFVSTKTGGLGLGLAISRRIMDEFGGELRAENHPDGGAVFHIVFSRLDGVK